MENKLQKIGNSFKRNALRAVYCATGPTGQTIAGLTAVGGLAVLGGAGGNMLENAVGLAPTPNVGTICGTALGLMYGVAGVGQAVEGKVADWHGAAEHELSLMEIDDRFLMHR